MYLGRILSVGTNEGHPYVAYRLSSRSFPNRMAKDYEDKAAIIPKEGYEKDIFENAYIAYNCIKYARDTAVVSNGSHTDVIADKINLGMNIKDAMVLSLLAMDYEKDDYNTPRIAGAMKTNGEGFIGAVTDQGLIVKKVNKGESYYISTYEHNTPKPVEFKAKTVKESSQFIIDGGVFKEFTNPVASVSSVYTDNWEMNSINL